MKILCPSVLLLAIAVGCGSSKSDGGSPDIDGGADCPFQGMWTALEYSCVGGTPQSFGAWLSLQIAITGATGTFKQVDAPCTNTKTGTVSCAGDTTNFSQEAISCAPTGCPEGASGCDMTPGSLSWTFTQPTATTLTTVSIDPTPISICPNTGMSNPITVYWQKQ